jgi:hypothetical protein
MRHRFLLRLAVLTALLALLLPLAAAADVCDDCLLEASPECCPASCCACCLPSPAAPGVSAPAALPPPLETGPAGSPEADLRLLTSSRDVFHVPKALTA